jgi:hypothetical protein
MPPSPDGARAWASVAIRTVPEIEVLTVSGCPHRSIALDRVRGALDRVGASQVVVTERVIDDPAIAVAAGMHGSPTVLIDGLDPFAVAGTEASVSCRLYRTHDRVDGAPSVDELVVALFRPERGAR